MASTQTDDQVGGDLAAAASAARLGIAVSPTVTPSPGQTGEDLQHRYINRELSTLDYFSRVLALAEDPGVPVLERTKFLAIFQTLLDEFFEVRVAGLKDQHAAGLAAGTDAAGLSPADQLRAIRTETELLVERRVKASTEIISELAQHGIRLSTWDSLDEDDQSYLERVFEQRIFPVLTPLAVDPGHPFPYISNLSLSIAVQVHDPATGITRLARIKVPKSLPRWVPFGKENHFVP